MKTSASSRKLFARFLSFPWQLAGVLLLSLLQVLVTIAIPVFIGRAINAVTGPDQVDFNQLGWILIQMLVLIGMNVLFQFVTPRLYNQMVLEVTRQLRNDLIGKFNRLSIGTIDKMSSGDLVSPLVNDVEIVGDGLLLIFNQFIMGILTILLTIVTMASLDWQMMILVVALTPLSILFARFIAKHSYLRFRDQAEARVDQLELVEESIQQIEVLRAFNAQNQAILAFERSNEDYATKSQGAMFFSSLTNPTTRFINAMIYAAVTYIGAIRIIAGSFSVGELTTFLNFATQYSKPFNDISSVLTEIQGALASADRIFNLLELEEMPLVEDMVQRESSEFVGQVTFDQVSFSYDPSQSLIENFNLRVEAGQRVAIVGPTGAGKSTLINLLMGFYPVDKGEIRIDQIPISQISPQVLRNEFGMVLQETWLKAGTIFENIAYAKPDASLDQVVEAAKKAHAHHFIMQLPKGYDTYLTDDGGGLSIGQQQLLSIARLFMKLPKVLILDEATSSIDTRTEVLIQSAFDELMQGRTSFVIAHRLSTIQSADLILVMQDGNIVEQGNHQELMQAGGLYSRMQKSHQV